MRRLGSAVAAGMGVAALATWVARRCVARVEAADRTAAVGTVEVPVMVAKTDGVVKAGR